MQNRLQKDILANTKNLQNRELGIYNDFARMINILITHKSKLAEDIKDNIDELKKEYYKVKISSGTDLHVDYNEIKQTSSLLTELREIDETYRAYFKMEDNSSNHENQNSI